MIVLGVHEGKNSSAALVKDGKVVSAVSEERLTRKKNESDFPTKSIEYCTKGYKPDLIVSTAKIEGAKVIDRQVAFANYAYHSTSPSGKTLVITADETGGSFSVWEEGEVLSFVKIENPLLRIYQSATRLLGLTPYDYKVMGLAPYAPPHIGENAYNAMKDMVQLEGYEFSSAPSAYQRLHKKMEGQRFDGIAYGVQKLVEERMVEWVKGLLKRYDVESVCFSGTLSLNVKLNKRLREIAELHVPPIGGEDVLSLGAAFSEGGSKLRDAYLGPSGEGDIESIARKKGVKILDLNPAKALAEGKIIGWVQGRMEFGARALGNRSILSDPRDAAIVKKLNNKVKFRDFWMPFTPSILEEDAAEYLVDHCTSSYMTLAFDSTTFAKEKIPATLHQADETVRPQTVSRGVNPGYHKLISDFKKITGVGCLLNTSFNLHGEPIVCTFEDAVDTFVRSGLDLLVVDGVVLGK